MSKYLYIIILFTYLCSNVVYGQIKIGDNPQIIEESSLLELESTSKVLIITRMSDAEMQLLQPLRGAIVFNTDEDCVFFYDGTNWSNLCNEGESNSNEAISLTANGDGTFTFLGTDQLPVTFNGANEVVSELEDNLNGTYTYTNEIGEETLVEFNGGNLMDNGDGTYTFTNIDGTVVNFNSSSATETVTTLVDNLDGTYTYSNEQAEETIISVNSGTLVDNGDGTYTFTNTDGSTITFNTFAAGETTSTLEDNLDGTYTYTNELGVETIVDTNSNIEEFTGIAGSVIFAGDDGKMTENNENIFWNNTGQRLGIKTSSPNSSVSVNGSLSTAIRFTGGDVGLNEADHTVLINGSGNSILYMPTPGAVTGRMYIVKKKPAVSLTVQGGYIDTNGNNRSDVPVNVIWLQSNGFNWEQVN